jgi:intracellular sulfur oxidation DsrE/DsrF family protein
MKDYVPVSKELLNAFVDDELELEERRDIIVAQAEDPGVARELYELRTLKDLVHAARPQLADDSAQVEVAGQPRLRNWFPTNWFTTVFAAASSVFIVFAVTMMSYWSPQTEEFTSTQTAQIYKDINSLLEAQAGEEIKLIFHVKQAGTEAAGSLFRQLDKLLADSDKHNRNVHIEVIASGPGLSLLRADSSPSPGKISYITRHYDNIDFVACQRSLLRQANKTDKEVSILPEALITHSGPELVKRRQRQGWSYIAI